MAHKILYLIPTLASGGAERQTAELVRHLDRGRFEPVVAVIYGTDRVPVEVPLGGTRLVSLRKPLGALGNLVALARLWRLIRREKPAIVQSFTRMADLYARIAAPLAGCRRVVTSLRTRVAGYMSPAWVRLERLLWRRSVCVVANSNMAAREAEMILGLPPSRLRVIPNGVDLERFRPGMDWRAIRDQFGFSASDLVLGMVARYSPVKDHATLLTAVAQLVRSDAWPQYARIFLAGGTTYPEARAKVDATIRELGLADVVRATGVVERVEYAYAAIDWLILPSRFESFPNSVLEAMACGKPVIVSDAANADGIVTEGVNGYIFPAGDVLSLVECLQRALAVPASQRVAMGNAARSLVEGQYSNRLMTRRFEDLYGELLGAK